MFTPISSHCPHNHNVFVFHCYVEFQLIVITLSESLCYCMFHWLHDIRKCCYHTFKAPCLVALNMHVTLHLLLFKQSMSVLIAIEIMYPILIKGKLYSIEDEDNNVLYLCFVFKRNCVKR